MKYQITKVEAIQALRPGAIFKIEDGVMEWLDTNQAPPNTWEIDAKIKELEIDYVWSQIKAYRDARQDGGNKINGYWFHSDTKSRIQQLALVSMGAGLPAGLKWKTMSGEFVLMTPQLAMAIFIGTAMSDQTIFAIAEQHRALMAASPNPSEYDYKVNWPEIYADLVPPVILPPPVFNGVPTPEMFINDSVVPEPEPEPDPGPQPTPMVQ